MSRSLFMSCGFCLFFSPASNLFGETKFTFSYNKSAKSPKNMVDCCLKSLISRFSYLLFNSFSKLSSFYQKRGSNMKTFWNIKNVEVEINFFETQKFWKVLMAAFSRRQTFPSAEPLEDTCSDVLNIYETCDYNYIHLSFIDRLHSWDHIK